MKMGKKRKFNRFVKWIKSDLPEEKTSVLLLGVTKLSSPKLQRHCTQNRPHTLHFEFPVSSSTTPSPLPPSSPSPAQVQARDNNLENYRNSFYKRDTKSLEELNGPSVSTIKVNAADVLTEHSAANRDNRQLPSTPPLAPKNSVRSRGSSLKTGTSFSSSSSKENNSPPVEQSKTKPSSFSKNPDGRKRVSFSKETEAIIQSRDTARRNRDLNDLPLHSNGYPEQKEYYTEVPIGFYNNEFKGRNIDDYSIIVDSNTKFDTSLTVKEEDDFDIGDILDAISDELNIKPISRQNSLAANEDSNNSHKFDLELLKRRFASHQSDRIQKPSQKSHSDNDISDRFIPNQQPKRKLSVPITPVCNRDVDIFLDEIINELDIGPKPPRSRSQSQSTESFENNGTRATLRLDNINESLTPSYCESPHPPSPQSNGSCIPKSTLPDVIKACAEALNMDRSVDSIGSCSLDVDLSTDFSDSSRGSISDCTLRSVSILTPLSNGCSPNAANKSLNLSKTPTDQNSSTQLPSSVSPSQLDPRIKIIDTSDQGKKPSYLNLACCVNGYSNLTTYDSKLRESYRSGTSKSREVSPNRPLSSIENYTTGYVTKGGETNQYLTPELAQRRTITSNNGSGNMADSNSFLSLHKSPNGTDIAFSNGSSTTTMQTFYKKTYMSSESRNFASSMLYNKSSTDVADGCQSRESSQKFFSISSSRQESFTSPNSHPNGDVYKHNIETSTTEKTIHTPTKSFIEQRVERLYGAGALAQSFIQARRQKSKISLNTSGSDSANVSTTEDNLKETGSSPSLPVLRHLRPEFRAQLPILSPKRSVENGRNSIPIINESKCTIKNGHTSVETLIPSVKSKQVNGDDDTKLLKESQAVENLINVVDSSDDISLRTSESLMHLTLDPNITIETITENLPAAPEVILPVIPDAVLTNRHSPSDIKNGNVVFDSHENDSQKPNSEVKDGHYFLKILKRETAHLIKLAEGVEEEMETKKAELPEDILGYLRSASGQARLLATQKMQQFEGLCHKNINQLPDEPFPTTAEDLQGFWDMVMLQVTQVHDLYKDLDEARRNNWVEVKIKKAESDINKTRKLVVKKPVASTSTANSAAQRAKREAQRKQMLEQRRKAMAAKKNHQEDDKNIEIFVPETSNS